MRRINRALFRSDGNWAGRVMKLRPGQQGLHYLAGWHGDVYQLIKNGTVQDGGRAEWLLDLEADLTRARVL